MTLAEEIQGGESATLELKEVVPKNSEKYLKTVVGFANRRGGKIVFGVENGTWRVVGVDPAHLFEAMDGITNAISDACHPAVLPNVSHQRVDGKEVIVVEVPMGVVPPYGIGSRPLEGVYLRVGATTRPADQTMLQELILAGTNRFFDQQVCRGMHVTSDQIDSLCKAMKREAQRNAQSGEERAAVRSVGASQLVSWGILQDEDGRLAPTNAYAILTGAGPLRLVTQCAVFRGTTRAVFLDRKEYAGPVWKQIEDTYQFVLRNIRMGADIVGTHRVDRFELPVGAIRELVINAALHRDYMRNENTQVAIYDDRIEVSSPGGLPRQLTLEEAQNGRSVVRNAALASAFAYMNLAERWGSGLPRVMRDTRERGLPAPEFPSTDQMFRVNVLRDAAVVDSLRQPPSEPGNGTEDGRLPQPVPTGDAAGAAEQILSLLREHPTLTQSGIASLLSLTRSRVVRVMQTLREDGRIERQGSRKRGKWVVKETNDS